MSASPRPAIARPGRHGGPDPNAENVLDVTDLRVTYGDRVAVDGVNLRVRPGQILALLGQNGAGKSSLVSAITGLRRASGGSIRVEGVDLRRAASRTRGVATQDISLYPGLTAIDNLRFFAELTLVPSGEIGTRIAHVAAALGLTDLLRRKVAHLSGGEQRRLHVAVAMLHTPSLLILDEPTAGLDGDARADLIAEVKKLAVAGSAVLYTTHYLPEVEQLDADVVVLDHGRVIASGPVDEIVRAYAATYVEVTFEAGYRPSIVGSTERDDGRTLLIELAAGDAELPRFIKSLGEAANKVTSLTIVPPSLDSALLSITGRRFHDNVPEAQT